MSTIICDFMGDSVLCRIAERLVEKDSLNFKYLISHTLPKSTSNLANLQHIDANQLYSVDRLYAYDNDLSYPIVDLIKDNYTKDTTYFAFKTYMGPILPDLAHINGRENGYRSNHPCLLAYINDCSEKSLRADATKVVDNN